MNYESRIKNKESSRRTIIHNSRFMIQASGFTLVELLVTVVIIVILIGIGLSIFGYARVSSRDSKRKQDLTNIAQALELYYQYNKVYPGTPGFWYCSFLASPCSGSISNPWIPNLIPNFINVLPEDPKQSSTQKYVYMVLSSSAPEPFCPGLSNGQYYILGALLESTTDKDSIGARDVKICNGSNVSSYAPFDSSPNWFVLTTP